MPTREQHVEDRQSDLLFAAAELWQCRTMQYTHTPELKLLPKLLGAELKAVI